MHKIIDAHAHLGYWPTLAKAKEMLIYSTNKNKVNFTLFSFDGTEVSGEHKNKIVPQIEGSKKALSFVKNIQIGLVCLYGVDQDLKKIFEN